MIVRPRPNLLSLMFTLRGSIVPLIAPRLLVVAAIAVALTVLHAYRPGLLPDISVTPFPLVGLALSIFLGFRNNACYDRWWEARKLWGQLLTETRGLAREAAALLPADQARLAQRRTIAFTHALRTQLRNGDIAAAIAPWLSPEDAAANARSINPSEAILRDIAGAFADCLRAGHIDSIGFSVLNARVAALGHVQAACERIKSAPTPFAYTLLVHRTAWLFCLLLPIGLPATAGPAAPVIAVIVAYAFFGLDALGDELEEPFAPRPNTIPLDAIARVVERDLLDAMGDADLPPPLLPVDYVLM